MPFRELKWKVAKIYAHHKKRVLQNLDVPSSILRKNPCYRKTLLSREQSLREEYETKLAVRESYFELEKRKALQEQTAILENKIADANRLARQQTARANKLLGDVQKLRNPDPEVIYTARAREIKPIIGDSYILVGPNGKIREIGRGAVKILHSLEGVIGVGMPYSEFVEGNKDPLKETTTEGGIYQRTLYLENHRLITLGPQTIFRSGVLGDKREYGYAVKVEGHPMGSLMRRFKRRVKSEVTERKRQDFNPFPA
jgi:hypothetical protein